MPAHELEYNQEPSPADISFLTKKINEETPDFSAAMPFAFFLKDADGVIRAGANGFIIYGSIYTDQLWVDRAYRNQGLAKKMMANVHELGKSHGCFMATIQTMDFQNAKNFYEKLGYTQDFARDGYEKKSSCIFMKKTL